MARAEVELDDPTKGRDDATTNSADDLLAQLAGDEVDRMLSEADAAATEPLNVDRAVPEASSAKLNPPSAAASAIQPSAADSANPNAVLEATEAALDGLFDELNASAPPPVGAASASASSNPAALPANPPAEVQQTAPIDKQSIEEVITQRAQDLIAQARLEAEDDALTPTSDQLAIGAGEPLSAADALAAEMEADEREHLEALKRMKQASPAPLPAAAKVEAAVQQASTAKGSEAAATQIDEDKVDFSPPDKADRIPLLVRLLEWINAPLSGLSDQVRAAIGKVAIITTLNAVAVFLYVMIFRHH